MPMMKGISKETSSQNIATAMSKAGKSKQKKIKSKSYSASAIQQAMRMKGVA